MMWSIRFSDGRYGPLVSREAAVASYNDIAEDRRSLCALTCWEQVADHDRDTERPPADPFSQDSIDAEFERVDASYRAMLPTLDENGGRR